jgi:hypothetical protein
LVYELVLTNAFPLPVEIASLAVVNADKAEATFEYGLERIALPKAERAQPQKIAIKAGSSQQEAIGSGSRD